MFVNLTRRLAFLFRTKEQTYFLDSLPSMKFNNDQQLIQNVRHIYDKREFLEECEAFSDVTNRIESYLLKNSKCTVAHLQCYYKLKQMRMVSIPFKHNLHRKYYNFLLDTQKTIKNEHLEKYLWFLYDQGRYQRQLFREAAQSHTLTLFQIYQYMNTLKDLPTWQPYIRIVNMISYLGHEIAPHKGLGIKKILTRIQHKYYPFIARLFTKQEMLDFQKGKKYDNPYLTYLCDQYVINNTSKYDSYLQRVELVQLQKQYQRIMDIMIWSEYPSFVDLALANFQINGINDELQVHISQMFFRLCQHADIDLQTIVSIYSLLLKEKNFMINRRFPIISRCTDSLFKKSLQEFSYLPTQAYLSALESSRKLDMDRNSRQELQRFICKQVEKKLIWNEGQKQRLKEFLEKTQITGSLELIAFLNQKGQ